MGTSDEYIGKFTGNKENTYMVNAIFEHLHMKVFCRDGEDERGEKYKNCRTHDGWDCPPQNDLKMCQEATREYCLVDLSGEILTCL